MTPAEKKERNFKLSKIIIDTYGSSFFRNKKILDLGSGDGELANTFARLGAILTCCDVREENLNAIKAKFPHINTVKVNLEHEFPFEELSFDLVLSIDVLCHIKNYQKHLSTLLSVSEHIILETEVLDSSNPNLLIPIFESKNINYLSFIGEGSLVSEKNIQNKISSLDAKYRRIDETKLNHGQFKYDWKITETGRKSSNRRFWIIKRDRKIIENTIINNTLNNINPEKIWNEDQVLKTTGEIKKIAFCLYGDINIDGYNNTTLKELSNKFDVFINYSSGNLEEIEKIIKPVSVSNEVVFFEGELSETYSIRECNRMKIEYEQKCGALYDLVIFKKMTNPLNIINYNFGTNKILIVDDDIITNSFGADIMAGMYDGANWVGRKLKDVAKEYAKEYYLL